ncbi:hypothetical protein LTS18_010359 [Coniosporium uncinatum]|uniref:Uncharacterized protein n=1 Tax=Coniosporium uncinatum TaxID=93489 RepID=A0ACC3DWK7_9PEZI|nr:hypothetical protein LTS18_010359 [Coniosporium uncinatum]
MDWLCVLEVEIGSVSVSSNIIDKGKLTDLKAFLELVVQLQVMATTELAPDIYCGLEAVVATLAAGSIRKHMAHLMTQEELQPVRAKIETLITEQDMLGLVDITQNTLLSYYMAAVHIYASKRRFYTTRDGRVGLGPVDLQEGDTVAILYGGKWPFVLRPKGDHYLFIGACYIHGLMQGEAFKMDPPPVERTFVLV